MVGDRCTRCGTVLVEKYTSPQTIELTPSPTIQIPPEESSRDQVTSLPEPVAPSAPTTKTKTEGSLLVMNIGIWMFVITMFLYFISGISAYYLAKSGSEEAPNWIGSVICGSSLILLLGMLLMLIGSILLFVNGDEFGPIHLRNTKLSLFFYILVIAMVGIMIMIPFIFITGILSSSSSEEAYDTLRRTVLMIAITGFLFTLFLSLSIVFSCLELVSEGRKVILWIGFALSIIASIVGVIVVAYVFSSDLAALTAAVILEASNVQYLSWGMSVIGLFILAILHLSAYKRVKRGEISPIRTTNA